MPSLGERASNAEPSLAGGVSMPDASVAAALAFPLEFSSGEDARGAAAVTLFSTVIGTKPVFGRLLCRSLARTVTAGGAGAPPTAVAKPRAGRDAMRCGAALALPLGSVSTPGPPDGQWPGPRGKSRLFCSAPPCGSAKARGGVRPLRAAAGSPPGAAGVVSPLLLVPLERDAPRAALFSRYAPPRLRAGRRSRPAIGTLCQCSA